MLNKAIIMGRLTADPELKHTQSGVAVASFTLAVDRRYKNEDGSRQADFLRCVAWRHLAEFVCKYFAKGRMLAMTGSIQTRSYTDREGNNRTAVEIVADEIDFTGERRPEAQSAAGASPYRAGDFSDAIPPEEYDIPLPWDESAEEV